MRPKFTKGPLYAELSYARGGRQHKLTTGLQWSAIVGAPEVGVMPILGSVEGDDVTAKETLDALANALTPLLGNTGHFGIATVFYQLTDEDTPLYIHSFGLTTTAAPRANQTAGWNEIILTLRTTHGHTQRLMLLDAGFDPNEIYVGADSLETGSFAGLKAFLDSPVNFICGRDGGRPFVVERALTKVNDVWRRNLMDI